MLKRTLRIVATGILGVLAVLLALLVFHQATHGRTRPIMDDSGHPVPGSVASLERVRLGGVEQTILVRGRSATLPVLLFLHGGPGMPAMFLAHRYQHELEQRFMVVHWDRRGAGKSYAEDLPTASLGVEQLIADTVELVELLRARFGVPKVYLVGHSWGSYLGLLVVQRAPQLFHAYVGVGQLAYLGEKNRELQDAFIERTARATGRLEAIEELRREGAAVREKWLFQFGAEVHDETSWWPLLWAGLLAPEYTLSDILHLPRGLGLYAEHLRYDALPEGRQLSDSVTAVAVPVYFFTGRYDYTDPFELTERYYERLTAPRKALVWFERSAHFPFLEEPQRFAAEMERVHRETSSR